MLHKYLILHTIQDSILLALQLLLDRSKCFGLLVLDHTQCRPNLHQLEIFNEVWNDMALTTLPFWLLGIDNWYASQSTTLRILVLALAFLAFNILTGCGSEDGTSVADLLANAENGGSGVAAPAGSAFASLAWDPVPDVVGYIVHYGTSSPGSPGSCAYAQSTFTTSPSATVTGLANNMTYHFAVSAYNGLESACSAEVSTVTSSA